MRNIIFFLIMITILIESCSMPEKHTSLTGNCSTPHTYESFEETMDVIDEYSQLIKKEQGIRNSSYGLFYAGEDKIYDGKIHIIALGYSVDKNMKYAEARRCFYSIVDGLLDHINKNTQLAQYFFHYPVDYSDLEFHFSFENEKHGLLKRDYMHSIHIARNEIFYEIVNEEGSSEIEKDQISPDIYIMQNILERNRSIFRPVPEDLAMHSNLEE